MSSGNQHNTTAAPSAAHAPSPPAHGSALICATSCCMYHDGNVCVADGCDVDRTIALPALLRAVNAQVERPRQ